MEKSEWVYEVKAAKPFDQAVVDVLKAVERKGWTVFGVIDIAERLAAKGFEQRPLKIIEICSGKHSNAMLQKDRLVSLCMPCKINVMQEGDGVHIAAMRPGMMASIFPAIPMEQAQAVEDDLRQMVDAAAGKETPA